MMLIAILASVDRLVNPANSPVNLPDKKARSGWKSLENFEKQKLGHKHPSQTIQIEFPKSSHSVLRFALKKPQ